MKRLSGVLLGFIVALSMAATMGSDPFLQLTNNTSAPSTATVPTGKGLLWMENGLLKTKVGTAITNVGSGVGGGGSSEWKQIWPPTSIVNPTVGTKTIGPLITGYLPDSVFNAAEYTPKGWRYETLRSGPF